MLPSFTLSIQLIPKREMLNQAEESEWFVKSVQIIHRRQTQDLYLKLLELWRIEKCDIDPLGINILFADVESETTK